jgi:outer membrane protein assembly factor BamB
MDSVMKIVVACITLGCLGTAAWFVSASTSADPAVAPPPLVAKPTTLDAKTWLMYGGTLARNMVSTEATNLPEKWDVDKKENVRWFVELGSQSYGAPTFAGGKLYLGTNNGGPRNPKIQGDKGVVMCFNESDGSFNWQIVHDKHPAGRVVDWPEQGICSSPYIEGDRIYYVSNRCELVCATTAGLKAGNVGMKDEQYKDETEGDIIWLLDMMKELGVHPHNLAVCSPIVVGDLIFIVTGNGHDESHENIPSPQAPSFICVNKKEGKVVWTNNTPSPKVLHGQWSNPCYGVIGGVPQVIFAAGDGWLYAFDPPTGKVLWQFDCNLKAAVYKLGGKGTRNYIIGTPVIWEDRIYINTGQDPEHGDGVGHLWCINPKGKSGDISIKNDNLDPKAAENKDSGLVWHVGGEKDGDLAWHRSMSTASIHDGILYMPQLYGMISALDARTGEKLWEHDTLSNIWGSCYYADGKVYCGTEEGDILVFKAGREKQLVGKYDMKGSVLSTPVAVGDTLYVMSKNRLYALKKQ